MENQNITAPEATAEVVDIQFRPGQKVYYFSPDGKQYKAGDHVIIDTARGPEFGTVAAGNHSVRASRVVQPLRKVLRKWLLTAARSCSTSLLTSVWISGSW